MYTTTITAPPSSLNRIIIWFSSRSSRFVSNTMPSCLRTDISAASLANTPSPSHGFKTDVFPSRWALMILGASVSRTSCAHSSLTNFGSSFRISFIAMPSSVSPIMLSSTPDIVYTKGFCEVSQNSFASSILSVTVRPASAAFLPRSVPAACCPILRELRRISRISGESCRRSFMASHALLGSFTCTRALGPVSFGVSASASSSSSSSSSFLARRKDSACSTCLVSALSLRCPIISPYACRTLSVTIS
mmetsp:Transcript_2883/g.6684  ORF Transcript_2883/g.6684 Transcript_2883/m.6684 type:complete len:248 (-) Transcript_2883:535-1278(-)